MKIFASHLCTPFSFERCAWCVYVCVWRVCVVCCVLCVCVLCVLCVEPLQHFIHSHTVARPPLSTHTPTHMPTYTLSHSYTHSHTQSHTLSHAWHSHVYTLRHAVKEIVGPPSVRWSLHNTHTHTHEDRHTLSRTHILLCVSH